MYVNKFEGYQNLLPALEYIAMSCKRSQWHRGKRLLWIHVLMSPLCCTQVEMHRMMKCWSPAPMAASSLRKRGCSMSDRVRSAAPATRWNHRRVSQTSQDIALSKEQTGGSLSPKFQKICCIINKPLRETFMAVKRIVGCNWMLKSCHQYFKFCNVLSCKLVQYPIFFASLHLGAWGSVKIDPITTRNCLL